MIILEVILHQSDGANKELLLPVYTAFIEPRLDCGSMAYVSATKPTLLMLDPVLYFRRRLASGAFRLSRAHFLYVECNK